MKTWHGFAFLLVVAVLIHLHLHYVLLLVAAIIGLFRGLLTLTERYPRTIFVILAIVRGLIGRR